LIRAATHPDEAAITTVVGLAVKGLEHRPHLFGYRADAGFGQTFQLRFAELHGDASGLWVRLAQTGSRNHGAGAGEKSAGAYQQVADRPSAVVDEEIFDLTDLLIGRLDAITKQMLQALYGLFFLLVEFLPVWPAR
jgi:hypothetical protein